MELVILSVGYLKWILCGKIFTWLKNISVCIYKCLAYLWKSGQALKHAAQGSDVQDTGVVQKCAAMALRDMV